MTGGIWWVTNNHVDGGLLLALDGGVVLGKNLQVGDIPVLVNLECVSQGDAHEWFVSRFWLVIALGVLSAQRVVRGLDVYRRNVVGQQHDLSSK